MQTKTKGLSFWCAVLGGAAGLALVPLTQAIAAEDAKIDAFYENATSAREGVGLS